MKKLQMRMGNNAPLDINQEYEETQNNEIDELAQMFTSPSIETPSKNKTNTDESNTENSSNTVNVSVDNIIPSKHNKFKQYEGEKQAAMIESIKFVRENTRKENKDIRETAELLKRIVNQDLFLDKDNTYKIIDGTAKDRIISTIDTQMRHGHKTSSKIQDGYKSGILTGGKNGELVIALETVPANAADGTKMGELLDEAENTNIHAEKLYGDSAYCDWAEIKKREGETEFCVKVRGAVNKNGMYTKDEFEINLEEGKIKCPAGNIADFNPNAEIKESGLPVKFDSELCKECPLRDKCTKSKTGRTVTINKNEKDILNAKAYQKTDEFKGDYPRRCNGERTISELTKHGGRQGRYIGLQKTSWQILMAAINNNIKKLMSFINNIKIPEKPRIEGDLCPFRA